MAVGQGRVDDVPTDEGRSTQNQDSHGRDSRRPSVVARQVGFVRGAAHAGAGDRAAASLSGVGKKAKKSCCDSRPRCKRCPVLLKRAGAKKKG